MSPFDVQGLKRKDRRRTAYCVCKFIRFLRGKNEYFYIVVIQHLYFFYPNKMAISSKKIADKPQVTDEDKQPGVVYIGHVPHGFHERQLRHYFSQFGSVLAVKLSRSQKTGKSKGYAFVKFRYAAVAKTVAETCHNYLFFNKLLKCEYRPLSEVHKDTFHSYKWKVNYKSKRLHNSAKDKGKLEKSVQKSVRRKQRKLNTLKKLGIELELKDVMNVPEVAVTKPKSSTEAE